MSKFCSYRKKTDHDDIECWCTRPERPLDSRTGVGMLKPEDAGLHKKTIFSSLRCRHSEHNAPTHLYVPGDSYFVHYCQQCGQKSVIEGIEVTL